MQHTFIERYRKYQNLGVLEICKHHSKSDLLLLVKKPGIIHYLEFSEGK